MNDGVFNFIKLYFNKICFCLSRVFSGIVFKQLRIRDNFIVFESEGDFCDNCRALYEYMIKNNYNKTYKLVWIVKEPQKYSKQRNIVFITKEKGFISSIKFFYYINISKYFFFTHPYWFTYKKENQKIINLWHGIPIKGSGTFDISKTFDYILCSSDNTKKWFNKFCGTKEEQNIILGTPRNDLLFEENNSLEKLLGTKSYNKIILCMPTFKQTLNWTDSENVIPYYIQGIYKKEDLYSLNLHLSNLNIILIVKIHHLQDTSFLKNINLSNIIYIKDEDLFDLDIQLYHLLGKSDVLLTDYSSVYLDYILLDRPIGFLLEDIESYSKGRGFIVDNPLDFMPGEKIYTFNDLLTFIDHVHDGIDDYKEERKKVRDYTNKYQDGNNCERLLKFLNL